MQRSVRDKSAVQYNIKTIGDSRDTTIREDNLYRKPNNYPYINEYL